MRFSLAPPPRFEKAAEHSRTPKRWRALLDASISARFWRAAVLNRFLLALTLSTSHAAEAPSEDEASPEVSYNQPWFLFDKADEIVPATLLENPLFYDAGVTASG